MSTIREYFRPVGATTPTTYNGRREENKKRTEKVKETKKQTIATKITDYTTAQRKLRDTTGATETKQGRKQEDEQEWWGDTMDKKDTTTIRVFCQNINGIKYDELGGETEEIGHFMEKNEIDVMGITEHNVDNRSEKVVSTIYQALQRVSRTFTHVLGGTETKTETTYKPGGTMIISRGNIRGRITEKGKDKLGRWTYQKIRCKKEKTLWMITAYQVCKGGTTAGFTAAAQQTSALRQQGDNAHPREAFKRDLEQFLDENIGQNDEAIIMGDYNEAIGAEKEGIHKVMESIGLVDLMAAVHGDDTPATFLRGTRCIDYILATPGILSAVTKTGYAPIHEGLMSDHRGFFVDLDKEKLFGGELPQLPTQQQRTFEASSPAAVTKYLDIATDFLDKRRVIERALELSRQTHPNHERAEAIDRDMTALLLAAAKKIKKYRSPPWVEELHHARRRVRIWKVHLRAHQQQTKVPKSIEELYNSMTKDEVIPTTAKECQTLLRKAQRDIRTIVKDAVRRRREELQRRAQEYASATNADDRSLAQAMRNIRKKEEIQEMFSRLRGIRGKSKVEGITTVKVPRDREEDPKTCNDWIEVDTPEEVEEAIRERNKTHFGQAEGTPFTKSPFKEQLDFSASTRTAELILEGKYDTSDCDKVLASVVSHLKKAPVPETAALVTEDEMRKKLKVWPEKTTTSPSGLHLGHWKALIANHTHSHVKTKDREKQERKLDLDAKQEALFEARLSLLNYATKWGYSYKRWQEVVNTMILKSPGDTRIHRLRVIHLYEADYNLLLAVKWRNALHCSEDAGVLNDGQYGSRPHRQALDPVYIEETMNEISRATRKAHIKFDNDATSCYDRILPQLAALAGRKFGLAKELVTLNNETLRQARYKLRTALGISETHYSHSLTRPIYGTGQGSGNSPIIWCFLSSSLFSAHNQAAHGATFATPDGRHYVKITMTGFVDDSTGQTNCFFDEQQPSPPDLQEKARHDAQLWNDLLWTSGGALELPKCSYHAVHWEFSGYGSEYMEPNPKAPPMRLTDATGDGNQITVKRLRPNEAHKTLGHYKEPSGDQHEQERAIKNKSDTLGDQAIRSGMTRKDAWVYYFAIYLPSITFPLANSFLSKKKLHQLTHLATKKIAAKCGFARTTPSAVLYGPATMGGAAFRRAYIEQGIGQLQLFIRHWRNKESQIGRLSRVAVHWIQYHCGTSRPFLQDVETNIPHSPSRWHFSVRAFLQHMGWSLELEDGGVPGLQREYDQHIMDIVLRSGKYTSSAIKTINQCRLYLQAATVADISNPAGTWLDRDLLAGNPNEKSSTTAGVKINQDRPSDGAWKIWQGATRLWANKHGKLDKPLGRWTVPLHQMRRRWHAYIDCDQKHCYRRDLGRTSKFYRHDVNDSQLRNHTETMTEFNLPSDITPVQIRLVGSSWRTVKQDETHYEQDEPDHGDRNSIRQRLDNQPETLAALHPPSSTNLDRLEDTLPEKALLIATDGGVQGQAGFGWIMASPEMDVYATGHAPVQGRDITSYRAELFGLLAAITVLNEAVRIHERAPQIVLLYCDNKSAVDIANDIQTANQTTFTRGGVVNALMAEYDVVQRLATVLDDAPTQLRVIHIKAHQDNDKPTESLSVPARMNVMADRLATLAVRGGLGSTTAGLIPGTEVLVHTATGTITRRLAQTARYDKGLEEIRQHIQRKNKWDDRTMDSIDWEQHSALQRRHRERPVQVTKLTHKLVPTNVVRHRYKLITEPTCPLCGLEPETLYHVVRCKHGTRKEWRQKLEQRLSEMGKQQQAPPDMVKAFIGGWASWMKNEEVEIPAGASVAIRAAMKQQEDIGWHQLLHGRAALAWRQTVTTKHTPYDGALRGSNETTWVTNMLDAIWTEWFKVWEERNEFVHGKTMTEKQERKRAEIEQKIRTIYENKDKYLPPERLMLGDDVEEFIKARGYTALANWERVWGPLFAKSAAECHRQALQGVRPITGYFKPAAPPGCQARGSVSL